MNRIRNSVIVLTAAGMLSMGATQLVRAETPAAADSSRNGTCSNADVAGAWGWTETGTVIPSTGAVPFAVVARYTLDADGNLSGTATSSTDGTIANLTLKGTGTVNSDCTNTETVGIYESGTLIRTATIAFVYVDDAQEGRGLVTSIVLANGTNVPSVLTINSRKLFR